MVVVKKVVVVVVEDFIVFCIIIDYNKIEDNLFTLKNKIQVGILEDSFKF